MVQPMISEPADDSFNKSKFSAPFARPKSVATTPRIELLPPEPPDIEINNCSELSINDLKLEDFSDLSDSETENEILLSQIISAQERGRSDRVKINYSRNELALQKNNLVIFISMNGIPFDNGAKELLAASLLPQHKTLIFERANVIPLTLKL